MLVLLLNTTKQHDFTDLKHRRDSNQLYFNESYKPRVTTIKFF